MHGSFCLLGAPKNEIEREFLWLKLHNVEDVGNHPDFPHLFQQVYAQEWKRFKNPAFASSIDELTCSKCGNKVSKCCCERKVRYLMNNYIL